MAQARVRKRLGQQSEFRIYSRCVPERGHCFVILSEIENLSTQ
jgi:hypothetical protein